MKQAIFVPIAATCVLLLVYVAVTYPEFHISKSDRNAKMRDELELIRERVNQHSDLLRAFNSSSRQNGTFEEFFKHRKEESLRQVSTRKTVLKSVQNGREFYNLYGALAAEVFCPEQVRIGTIGDGGKWVCNPWNVPQNAVLFSLGLNNFVGFEENWQKLLSDRNRIFGFDSADQNDTTKGIYARIRGVSRKVVISELTSPDKQQSTIGDLVKDANVSAVEILKIDIEGAEKTCLIPFLEKYTVCQIYLELHGGADEHARLLQKIAHLGYRLFSYEVNGYTMSACEYSFIHESCVDKYGGRRIANYLDFDN